MADDKQTTIRIPVALWEMFSIRNDGARNMARARIRSTPRYWRNGTGHPITLTHLCVDTFGAYDQNGILDSRILLSAPYKGRVQRFEVPTVLLPVDASDTLEVDSTYAGAVNLLQLYAWGFDEVDLGETGRLEYDVTSLKYASGVDAEVALAGAFTGPPGLQAFEAKDTLPDAPDDDAWPAEAVTASVEGAWSDDTLLMTGTDSQVQDPSGVVALAHVDGNFYGLDRLLVRNDIYALVAVGDTFSASHSASSTPPTEYAGPGAPTVLAKLGPALLGGYTGYSVVRLSQSSAAFKATFWSRAGCVVTPLFVPTPLFSWNGTDLSQLGAMEGFPLNGGGPFLGKYTLGFDGASYPAQPVIDFNHPGGGAYVGLYFLPMLYVVPSFPVTIRISLWHNSGAGNHESYGIGVFSADRTGFTVSTATSVSSSVTARALESGVVVSSSSQGAGGNGTDARPGITLCTDIHMEAGALSGYPDGLLWMRKLRADFAPAGRKVLTSTLAGVTPANWVGKTLDTVGIVVSYPSVGNDPAHVRTAEFSVWPYPGPEVDV